MGERNERKRKERERKRINVLLANERHMWTGLRYQFLLHHADGTGMESREDKTHAHTHKREEKNKRDGLQSAVGSQSNGSMEKKPPP